MPYYECTKGVVGVKRQKYRWKKAKSEKAAGKLFGLENGGVVTWNG